MKRKWTLGLAWPGRPGGVSGQAVLGLGAGNGPGEQSSRQARRASLGDEDPATVPDRRSVSTHRWTVIGSRRGTGLVAQRHRSGPDTAEWPALFRTGRYKRTAARAIAA